MKNKNQANQSVRKRIEKEELHYWQVADEVGIAANTLTVWLRKELDDEKKARVNEAIDRLIKKQEA